MKRLYILALIPILAMACSSYSRQFSEEEWKKKVQDTDTEKLYENNYRDGRYENPWLPWQDKSVGEFLEWVTAKKPRFTEHERNYLPAVIPHALSRIMSLPARTNFIMWIGHNSFLIRINGAYWLVDPMLSSRSFWTKRKTPPAVTAAELRGLPGPLTIIITHNHYDHLDSDTIKELPASVRIFAPLGLRPFFEDLDRLDITEMNWWQSHDCGGGIRLHCLPAQHWSRRVTTGTNRTLWAGFMLESPGCTVYIAGDSGYFKGFEAIGKKFPNIDYALMPVTSYRPRWFMHYAHMDIDETLRAFDELGAHNFIPAHWGTFSFGYEPAGYPVLELKEKITKRKLDRSRFLMMSIGEIITLPGKNSP